MAWKLIGEIETIKGDPGDKGDPGQGAPGVRGDPFTYADFTPEQLAQLKGKTGDKGNSGVYIGTTTPTDDEVNVWINPEGSVTGVDSSDININLEDYYTKTETDNKLNVKVSNQGMNGVPKFTDEVDNVWLFDKIYYNVQEDRILIPSNAMCDERNNSLIFSNQVYTKSEIDNKLGDIESALTAIRGV